MNPTKVPGSNGARAFFFFSKILEDYGEDIVATCLNVLNKEEDLRSLNKTLISLIPKCGDAKHTLDFQPISLCNVIYKIIAKTMANRLKRVMNSLVSPNQSTFVPRGLIVANYLEI